VESRSVRRGAGSAAWNSIPSFPEPLHVGRPNIGDRATFNALVDQMLDRHWLSNDGPLLQEFERRIAEYADVEHCVAVTNGTAALEILVRVLGLSGEVIVPSYTFVATAHALQWQGITPVFADIDPATHNLDPEAVRRAITARTTGILAVHLWGRPAPIRELQAIADEHGLQLAFDAAHAFGNTFEGKRIGGFGRAEVFSFHATKFFNSFEGGAIVTDDDEIAEAARLMRNFGFAGADNVISAGTNAKMTEVCAAMGLTNLQSVDAVIETNLRNYRTYQAALTGVPGVHLTKYNEAEQNNFQYITIEVDDGLPVTRDEIVEALSSKNVLARKYFWPGAHRMQPYRDLYPSAGDALPHTASVARRVIVLPTGAAVDEAAIRSIADMLRVLTGADAL